MKKNQKSYTYDNPCHSSGDIVLEIILVPYATNSTRTLIKSAFNSATEIEKSERAKECDNDRKTPHAKVTLKNEAEPSRMTSQFIFLGGYDMSMPDAVTQDGEDNIK